MLSAIQISKKFKDRIILNETSCEFEKGKSYAIIGQSDMNPKIRTYY